MLDVRVVLGECFVFLFGGGMVRKDLYVLCSSFSGDLCTMTRSQSEWFKCHDAFGTHWDSIAAFSLCTFFLQPCI